ncbi:MAG: amino acid permease [Fibrobacter sp.]|nr:amino acid permease [Fibrobacter sp.]
MSQMTAIHSTQNSQQKAGNTASEPKKFSTFAGVFTPSILTIFGVIMFMRAGFVVGHAGIMQALLILFVSKMITTTTGLSISAIATNTDVKGGGAYFLISRTLGPEFGGTIGLALFLAQTLSVPFYILGFTESLIMTFPALKPFYLYISLFIAVVLFIITNRGADWAIKVQYVIMGALGLSIVAFLAGGALKFDHALFDANMARFNESKFSFWQLFAIYFPAATGIMAGVNMSGDLKNPARSIPLGTLGAIGVAVAVYVAQILLLGGSVSREALIEKPYQSLMSLAPFHTGFLIVLGVFCATLSSAIGSMMGAPRILQSLGQDRLLKPANFFAEVSKSGEPKRALWLTLVISLIVIYFAGKGNEGGALNLVASMVTMLFLWTYGITNLAAFIESFSRNPSFRPRFKLFHWIPALIGAVSSFAAAFLVDAPAALAAVALVVGLFLYVRKFILVASFGDARRGFFYSRTRDNLLTLAQLPVHSKNWRPTIIVFSGNPQNRLTLTRYADWLGSGRGIVTIAGVLSGNLHEKIRERRAYMENLEEFIRKNHIRAFPDVLVTPDFDLGLNQFLQVTSIGPIKPNLVMFGWSSDPNRAPAFVQSLRTAKLLNMSIVLVRDGGLPDLQQKKRKIDVWWSGKRNGSLMVILAYLISLDSQWSGTSIRILRAVENEYMRKNAEEELKNLIESSRMNIAIQVILSGDPLEKLIRSHSSNANVIFLGFEVPEESDAVSFQNRISSLSDGLPTVLLVRSTGEADLTS